MIDQLDIDAMMLGRNIADTPGLVTTIQPDSLYEVKSTKDPATISYEVLHSKEAGWICSCPQTKFRRKFCKHIAACQLLLDRVRRAKILSQPYKSSRLLVAPSC